MALVEFKESDFFYGDLVKQVEDRLNKRQSVVIYGKTGAGKTCLAYEIVRRLESKNKKVHFMTCASETNFDTQVQSSKKRGKEETYRKYEATVDSIKISDDKTDSYKNQFENKYHNHYDDELYGEFKQFEE